VYGMSPKATKRNGALEVVCAKATNEKAVTARVSRSVFVFTP
jgi:hypothetical protein